MKTDAARLCRQWQAIQARASAATPPCLIAPGPTVAQRTILDAGDPAVIRVASPGRCRALGQWLQGTAPELGGRLRQDDSDLVDQVVPLLEPQVPLAYGAWLSIEPTTALTAIDVNAGGARDPMRANLEAADAIAAQLRLRNLGGTVVIDFISLRSAKARGAVMAALKAALAGDPARLRTGRGFSELGLVELARKRRGLALHEAVAAS